MADELITVRPRPCPTCPYRRDVPPGVWHEAEYEKLIEYDGETWEQPLGVFMCHTARDKACAGWAGCHDMENSLAVRFALSTERIDPAIMDYECPVPLWGSGTEAARHGMSGADISTGKAITKLRRLRERRHARGTVVVLPASGEAGGPGRNAGTTTTGK